MKERDICIETCPVSNMLLGYVTDLRNHPVRWMLNRGIQATISNDGPTFFGYEGVAMDYFMVFIAWDLSLRDLKKLCLNSIKYANISEDHKRYLTEEVFPKEWNKWVHSILAINNGHEEKSKESPFKRR